jgi:hypothetical protein
MKRNRLHTELRGPNVEVEMKGLLNAACAIAIAAAFSPSLLAQWPPYPTPQVPKTADGKPNLSAAAPRTPDGKPDLSGIWENFGEGRLSGGISGTGGAPLESGVIPTTLPGFLNQFFDIGVRVKGGLPFQPWAAELRKKRMADNSKDNPDAHCLPMGNMQMHTHPQPRKMIQAPGVIVMLYEGNAGIRQIFTDGRPVPNNDPQPWWYGYSTGKWEGDTLVVQTTGFRDDVWLDVYGSPLTSAGKMTERFRRVNYGTLELEITVDDPKAYTRPWAVTINQRIMLDTELIEFVCAENEKSTRHFDK